MYKAVFVDFYGTLVRDDDGCMHEICERIRGSAGVQATTAEIDEYWWNSFSNACRLSYGDSFRTQRELELRSLQETIAFFESSEDSRELCELLYRYWLAPGIYEDTHLFLESAKLPVIVLSNIDRPDIQAAIERYALPIDRVLTSEDVRSYKPRPELFRRALAEYDLKPEEALHVGDSLGSDVAGARNAGIRAVWMNRRNKPVPQGVEPDFTAASLCELLPLINGDVASKNENGG